MSPRCVCGHDATDHATLPTWACHAPAGDCPCINLQYAPSTREGGDANADPQGMPAVGEVPETPTAGPTPPGRHLFQWGPIQTANWCARPGCHRPLDNPIHYSRIERLEGNLHDTLEELQEARDRHAGLEVYCAVILDLYAGVGWAEGLRALSLAEIGVDLDPAVCATRRAAGLETIRADVTTWPAAHLAGQVEGLIASPPCVAFSRAGKRLGMADLPALYELVEQTRRTGVWASPAGRSWHDDRSPLVLEPLRFVGVILPDWVALEQVPDVLPLWRCYAQVLERWGYRTWAGVLNSANYGVPQTRERAILMASRTRPVRPPVPTHSDQRRGGSLFGLAPWVSMAVALGWGWDDTPARTVCGDRGPRWAYPAGNGPDCRTGRVLTGHTNANGKDFDPSTRPARTVAGEWRLETEQRSEVGGEHVPYLRGADRPAPVITGNADRWEWKLRMGNQTDATRRALDEPAPTVLCGHRVSDIRWTTERPATTVQGTPRIGRPGHKDRDHGGESQHAQSIRVSLDELAVLQGFPAGYPWQGNKSQRATQVGNAVPPPLAAAIVGTLRGAGGTPA